jgi:PTS system mannose-specific IIA component
MEKAAEMIVGSQQHVFTIGLDIHLGLEDMVVELEKQILHFGPEIRDILILTDLHGGTPSNAVCLLLEKYDVNVVSGVNLPMLLEVFLNRDKLSVEELVDLAIWAGKEGVQHTDKILREKMNCDERRAQSE